MLQKISKNIFVENGFHGCNSSFIVTVQGVVLIDTPVVPAEAKTWRNKIAEYGEIQYVINSEPHPDHVSGNCWLGGKVVAHEGTRQIIQNMRLEELVNLLKQIAPESLPLDIEFKYRLPEITFSQNLTIFLGGHTFQLFNIPGHTPYQLAIYVPEEKAVFTSDNVNLEMPIFSFDSMPYAWLDSLKRLQQIDVETIIPGHGSVCEKSSIQVMYDIVQNWIESINSAIKQGWGLEETLERVHVYPQSEKNEMMKTMKHRSIVNLYEILKA